VRGRADERMSPDWHYSTFGSRQDVRRRSGA
jgi:ribosomal protein L20A (L18A)